MPLPWEGLLQHPQPAFLTDSYKKRTITKPWAAKRIRKIFGKVTAFLCFPSWEDYRSKLIQRRSLWHSDNSVPSRIIHLRNHNCRGGGWAKWKGAWRGRRELNEPELRTEPENLSGTQTWSRQIRNARWGKRNRHPPQMGHTAHRTVPHKVKNETRDIVSLVFYYQFNEKENVSLCGKSASVTLLGLGDV